MCFSVSHSLLVQLLKRIVEPDFSPEDIEQQKQGVLASRLYDYTHGINADPVTLLAIVFSALIHDADHRGGRLFVWLLAN